MAAVAKAEMVATSLHAPMCIAIVDDAGLLQMMKRMDGARPGCAESAISKARAAALYQTPTLVMMDRVNHGEPALATLPDMIPLGGGIPVKKDDKWIGAVGASGAANPIEVQVATSAVDVLSR